LLSADAAATAALDAYGPMDYLGAVTGAQQAYQTVLDAAAINVQVEPQAWQADYRAKSVSDKFVDEVDYDHRFRP
jgi:hypothetical protein